MAGLHRGANQQEFYSRSIVANIFVGSYIHRWCEFPSKFNWQKYGKINLTLDEHKKNSFRAIHSRKAIKLVDRDPIRKVIKIPIKLSESYCKLGINALIVVRR